MGICVDLDLSDFNCGNLKVRICESFEYVEGEFVFKLVVCITIENVYKILKCTQNDYCFKQMY